MHCKRLEVILAEKLRNPKGRGREQLLENLVNPARAYNYLKRICCSNIRFIPRSTKKDVETSDLEGRLGSIKVLCEVKTINPSDEEVCRRQNGDYLQGRIHPQFQPLTQEFFNKLKETLNKAKKQLKNLDRDDNARRIVYVVFNFDDFWSIYKQKHFQQIDDYLSKPENFIPRIKMVFHNQQIGFPSKISMKNAEVVNDPL